MAIIIGMITFCLGSARQKRAYIKSIGNAVLLDNIEVLFCASENGYNYFAYGKVPFSDFTVSEYLLYRRALCEKKVSELDVALLGLDKDKRIGKLNPAQMRCVTFLEKTCGYTSKTVIVNLDGARYTRRAGRALNRLLSFCDNAYVFVTDERFERRARFKREVIRFGKEIKRNRPKFYAAKRLAAAINATFVSVM